MNTFEKAFGLLVALALLAALGAAAYLAFEFVVSQFAGLDAQVARVTAIGSTVALLAAMLIASGVRDAGRRSKASQIREQKAATYRLFVDCWIDSIRRGAATHEDMPALDRLLALYGGAAVVRSHALLRTMAQDKGAGHADVRARFGKALEEVRRDLGSDVGGLSAQELQRLILA